MRRWVAAWCVACCALGCRTAGLHRSAPPPCLPSEYQSEGAPPPQCSDDLTYWWYTLRDPTLNRLIHDAACQNLTLREAAVRMLAAREQYLVVRGGLWPKFGGTAGFSSKQTSLNGNQFVIPQNLQRSFDLYSMGFDTGWEIPLWGKYRSALQTAGADVAVTREVMRDAKVTLLGDVAVHYVTIRSLQQRLQVARENLTIQQETLRLVESRVRSGVSRELDAAQARSNLHATASQIPPLEEQLRIATNGLCVLLGYPPTRHLDLFLGQGTIPQPPVVLAVGVPAELLRRRPDVRGAEFGVLGQGGRIGLARAELYPQFNLKGTLTVDSRTFSNWFTGNSIAYSFGPSARWDLFNFGRLRANVRVQQRKFQEATVHYQATVLQAAQEVENGLVSFLRQQQRAAELEQAVAANSEAVRLSAISYQNGLVAFQTVLDSQRQLVNLQDDLVSARAEVVLAAVKTYKAAGGGWQASFRGGPQVVARPVPPAVPQPEPPDLIPDEVPLPKELEALPLPDETLPDDPPAAAPAQEPPASVATSPVKDSATRRAAPPEGSGPSLGLAAPPVPLPGNTATQRTLAPPPVSTANARGTPGPKTSYATNRVAQQPTVVAVGPLGRDTRAPTTAPPSAESWSNTGRTVGPTPKSRIVTETRMADLQAAHGLRQPPLNPHATGSEHLADPPPPVVTAHANHRSPTTTVDKPPRPKTATVVPAPPEVRRTARLPAMLEGWKLFR